MELGVAMADLNEESGESEASRSQSNRDEVGAHPTRAGLVMGVGSRNAPDWRCNGCYVALVREGVRYPWSTNARGDATGTRPAGPLAKIVL